MITIKLDLSDGMKRELDSRVRDSAYPSIDEYVRDLIRSDLERDDSWEMTPEIAAALAEGAASGYEPYDYKSIVVEAKAKFRTK